MKALDILRAVAVGFGIFIGAFLGFWTAAVSFLTGPESVGLSAAWYGLVDVALTYLVIASGTASGVLHITDYAARISGRRRDDEAPAE